MKNIDNKEFNRTFSSNELGVLYASLKFSIDNHIFDNNQDVAEELLKKIINC